MPQFPCTWVRVCSVPRFNGTCGLKRDPAASPPSPVPALFGNTPIPFAARISPHPKFFPLSLQLKVLGSLRGRLQHSPASGCIPHTPHCYPTRVMNGSVLFTAIDTPSQPGPGPGPGQDECREQSQRQQSSPAAWEPPPWPWPWPQRSARRNAVSLQSGFSETLSNGGGGGGRIKANPQHRLSIKPGEFTASPDTVNTH